MIEYKKVEPMRIKSLFAISSFKRKYSDSINDTLRKLYQKEQKWGKLLSDGNYGVIDTNYDLSKLPMNIEVKEFFKKVYDNKDPRWSLLNYVNTHWSSFAEITNTLNLWILKGKIKGETEPLDFDNNYFEELDRIIYLITREKENIFFPQDHLNLTIFWRIMNGIAMSTFYGNKGENLTLETLSNLGEITDVIKSNPGQKIDTHNGIDLRFRLSGVPKTLQCKSYSDLQIVDGLYIFRNISNPGWYNVDYFSFVGRGKIYVFDTKRNGLRYKEDGGTYIFDEELLKYEVKI